jgi:hypothetical protein
MRNYTDEQLREIISWYAERVYYNMDHAIEEIEWLTDNLKLNAFNDIIDFYESNVLQENIDSNGKDNV